jgi:hypothetical protein
MPSPFVVPQSLSWVSVDAAVSSFFLDYRSQSLQDSPGRRRMLKPAPRSKHSRLRVRQASGLTSTRRLMTESLGTLHIEATCFGSNPRQRARSWL